MNPVTIDQEVTCLPGVGSSLAQKLARRDIHTLQDLAFHLPLRYEDRTRLTRLNHVQPGAGYLVEGELIETRVTFGRRRSLRCILSDGSGTLILRFFHFSRQQQRRLEGIRRIRSFGEIRRGADGFEMYHPEYLPLDSTTPPLEKQLTPVYPTTQGVSQARIRSLVNQALVLLVNHGCLSDILTSDEVPDDYSVPLIEALRYLHAPPVGASLDLLESGLHPTQRRLAFEELLAHHLSLLVVRRKIKGFAAPGIQEQKGILDEFKSTLEFDLTDAQCRVMSEITNDIAQPHPMLRLLQGDVGSGKTIVAALTTLLVASCNIQTVLMAPTEILAEQHLKTFRSWFRNYDLPIAWLSGKLKGKKRAAQLELIANGGARLVIGTHALFQNDVVFANLGLIIVDEQHKFGVHQRLALRDKAIEKGIYPHQLVMTATPIPRTLTMSIYADLDTSVIDELPPGRIPITTSVISDERRAEVIERVDAACRKGKQVYWVCTLIEESDVLSSSAAETAASELARALPNFAIGLIHGRMTPDQKNTVMDQFSSGTLSLLVATTVIEVGVNVPNASLMIIENAERLGLAQLHQLRGRVGRGNEESHCLLMYHSPLSEASRQRLHIMRTTNDGFLIAEEDLKIRGPGEVLGTRQTGEITFRIADLRRDELLLPEIRDLGSGLLTQHPDRAQLLMDRWLTRAESFSQV